MKHINKNTYGPWALVTGASSGIGKEFARQLAASGLNLVLVAQRLPLLEEVGRALADEYGIRYRAMALDLSEEGFLEKLETVTRDLDIGLVVSNAGSGTPSEFLNHDSGYLHQMVRLSEKGKTGVDRGALAWSPDGAHIAVGDLSPSQARTGRNRRVMRIERHTPGAA